MNDLPIIAAEKEEVHQGIFISSFPAIRCEGETAILWERLCLYHRFYSMVLRF